MAAFQAQVLDVSGGSLRYPQPVQGEQGNQRVLSRRSKTGGDEERAELVAIKGGGVRLIVQPRTADMGCGRVVQELFLDGVLVEPGVGAQPPGHGGTRPAIGLQFAG